MPSAEELAHHLADGVLEHQLDDVDAIELAKVYAQLAMVDAVDRLRLFLQEALEPENKNPLEG